MTSLEAYRILLERQINEDRILAERTHTFLLATAFIFLAFVMLLDPKWDDWLYTVLRITLPLVGMFLTFLLFSFNHSASIANTFWHKAQRKIEEDAMEFYYMRINDLTPHIAQEDYMTGQKDWTQGLYNRLILVPVTTPKRWWQKRLWHNKVIYRCFIPITFGTLWVVALAVAIARAFS